MANVTYDIMWREGMMELLDQLEAENPEDINLAPKVTGCPFFNNFLYY